MQRTLLLADTPGVTENQRELAKELDAFLGNNSRRCFLLKGYAGTGKTFMIKAISDYLDRTQRSFSLLAPTGRAARVLRQRTGHESRTIHSAIYSFHDLEEPEDEERFRLHFKLREPADEDMSCVFIVDEASMVGDRESETEFMVFGSGRLLADLIQFSRIKVSGLPSKVIFVGDPAQLPPVGDNKSPALDEDYLLKEHGVESQSFELQEVVRQKRDSMIYENATRIRQSIRNRLFNRFEIKICHGEVEEANVSDLPKLCLSPNHKKPEKSTILITYTNASALSFNRILRARIFGMGDQPPLQQGDNLIVHCNNRKYGISNGDFVEVLEVMGVSEIRVVPLKKQEPVRLSFRKLKIGIGEENGARIAQDCLLLENLLESEEREISRFERIALYVDFKKRHLHLKPKTAEFTKALLDDPYINAIQAKYGYAITCHKAQGGEWQRVVANFGDMGGRRDEDSFRLCYTAITRARNHLYVIAPPSFKPWTGKAALEGATDSPTRGQVVIPAGCEANQQDAPAPSPVAQSGPAAGHGPDFGGFGADSRPDGPPPTAPEQNLESLENSFSNCFPFLLQVFRSFQRVLQGTGILVEQIRHMQFQERYFVRRGEEGACFQFWYNQKGQLRPCMQFANPGDSDELAREAIELFHRASLEPDESLPDLVETPSFPEDKPFLEDLYQEICRLLADASVGVSVVHHQYMERYLFKKGSQQAYMDFYYNAKGFFTSRTSRPNHDSSAEFLRRIETALTPLFQEMGGSDHG